MTIEVFGHVESMSVGPLNKVELTIRVESARSQELIKVLASHEELGNLYRPGKGITIRITPAP